MNCSSLQDKLRIEDPDKNFQLWGLAYQDNNIYCDWSQMMWRMFYGKDFETTLTNPLYQAQIMQQSLDSIFYPACYVYSIVRILVVCVIFFYVRGKLKAILREMGIDQNQIMIFSQAPDDISLSNSQIDRQTIAQQPGSAPIKRIKISQEKNQEIMIYRFTIYFAVVLELICALRDFVLFRGMLMYTNIMEDMIENCYIDIIADQFTCNQDKVGLSQNWESFSYQRTTCNCLYYQPLDYFDNGVATYMTTSILLWILTEGLTIGITTFTVLTLSRINRKEKSGLKFLTPVILKSIGVTVFCIFLFSLMIYAFQVPIYYRFYNTGVVVFYFFWKFLGFILIFDKLYSKIWLEWKLRFQSLHSHGIEWNEHMARLKKKITKSFGQKMYTIKAQVKPHIQQEFGDFVDNHQCELKKIYEAGINKYFQESVQPYIVRAEKEANAKLKTKWYDYLNYMLLMNLIGMIGFGFLVIYGFVRRENPQEYSYLFWFGINNYLIILFLGFILAIAELIVFEISNIIFKLHGFFIELYKNIKLEESQKEIEEEQDDQDFLQQEQQ